MSQGLGDAAARRIFREAARAEDAPSPATTLAAARRRLSPRPRRRLLALAAALAAGAALVLVGYALELLPGGGAPRAAPVVALAPVETAPLPAPRPAAAPVVGAPASDRPTKQAAPPPPAAPPEPPADPAAEAASLDLRRCLEERDRGDIDSAMDYCHRVAVSAATEIAKGAAREIAEVGERYKAKHLAAAKDGLRDGDGRGLYIAEAEYDLLVLYFGGSDPDARALKERLGELSAALDAAAAAAAARVPTPPYKKSDIPLLIGAARKASAKKLHKEALELLDEAKKLDPGNGELYRIYGAIYTATGDVDEMCSSYRTFIKLSPRSPLRSTVRARMEYYDKGLYPACDTSSL
jgi:tetratricopeptide (TPR) repeat protein